MRNFARRATSFALVSVAGSMASVLDAQSPAGAAGSMSATAVRSLCDQRATQDLDAVDLYHPRNFVRIFELTQHGDSVWVLKDTVGATGVRKVRDAVNAQVDINSRLVIGFDRNWLTANSECAEADIVITGEVTGSGGKRNIEIPGYSVVGEATKTASARMESIAEMIALLNEFRQNSDRLRLTLAALQSRAEQDADLPKALQDSLSAARSDSISLADKYFNAYQQAYVDTGGLKSTEKAVRALIADSARARVDANHRVMTQLLAEPAYREKVWPSYVNSARSEILEQRNIFAIPLALFTDSTRAPLLSALARALRREPAVLASKAQNISPHWLADLDTSDAKVKKTPTEKNNQILLSRDAETIDRIQNALVDLAAVGDTSRETSQKIAAIVTRNLKDTDVLVSQTGAQNGDEILLTISNGIDRPVLNRSLKVRIRVTEFGLVGHVVDSFLLIQRLGVSKSASASAVQAAQQSAASGGAATTVATPLPVNYTPAPGATLGWTYFQRRNTDNWDKFVRWIQPGFGINVSFPQFGSKVTSFSPSTSSTSGTGSTTSTPPTATVTTSSNNIDIATGLVLSFFNSAVILTYGNNLTSDSPRAYWGIGFSFVKLVQGVSQAGASGSKSATAASP